MLAGDQLTPADSARLGRAIRIAEEASGFTFSVFLTTAADDSRAYALRLHGSLDEPDRSVLVLCDPGSRILEIVTGRAARRALSDRVCALAAATMRSSFVAGDVVGGLENGLAQLGEAGRQPPTLHSHAGDE